MNIDIASRDERYIYLNELLNYNGYNSKLINPTEINNPDILVLSVRDELDEASLSHLLKNTSKNTRVFTGRPNIARKYFDGEIVDYSQNETFLLENARLTAEAMISVWYNETKESPKDKKILISGYGRIGKYLSKLFSSLGAEVFVYARREEIRKQVLIDGYIPVAPEFAVDSYAVMNTAPAMVFSKDLISHIPKETYLFELASVTGFEKTERVIKSLGLPGKILPQSAGKVIYETITSFF